MRNYGSMVDLVFVDIYHDISMTTVISKSTCSPVDAFHLPSIIASIAQFYS